MKQFLAILKDSYREAKDARIVYVMIAVSALLVFLVATIHYRPLKPEEVVGGGPIRTINSAFGFQRRFAQPGMALPPSFAIENFHHLNEGPEPWSGWYEFDFLVRFDKESDRESAKMQGLPVDIEFVRSIYTSPDFYFLKGVKVKEVPGTPTENRYHVSVEGTNVHDARSWIHEPEILFGAYGLGTQRSVRSCVYYVEKWLVQEIGSWITILVGVVITAFFIPNMLRKGTLDLFISKPIHRVTLLIYKYVGGLMFMLMTTTLTVGGIWLAVGLSTGIWTPRFLMVIPAMVFYFAILYAVSTLIAVFTRSPILAILVTCVAWGIFYANGFAHAQIEQLRDTAEFLEHSATGNAREARRAMRRGEGVRDEAPVRVRPRLRSTDLPGVSSKAVLISDFIYTVLPRTSDLDEFTANFIGRRVLSKEEQAHHELHAASALFDWYELDVFGMHLEYPVWLETLLFSLGFIAVMLVLACWRFVRLDA